MTSQIWKQIITMYILPNISRIKDRWTMKFGQLIEYKILETSYTKYDEAMCPRSFYKKCKLSIFLGRQSEFL